LYAIARSQIGPDTPEKIDLTDEGDLGPKIKRHIFFSFLSCFKTTVTYLTKDKNATDVFVTTIHRFGDSDFGSLKASSESFFFSMQQNCKNA
jgi:hypothetical protein